MKTVSMACVGCDTLFDYVPRGGYARKFCTNKCQSTFNNARKKGASWASQFKSKYGITLEDRDAMRIAQDFRCAICGRHEEEVGTLHTDHDHATGAIRSMLCHACNKGLGLFKDNPEDLMAAAAYLIQHKGGTA